LRAEVEAREYVDGFARRVIVPLTDLRRAPGRARDRQLLLGEAVTVLEIVEGQAFVQAAKDGYVGYVGAETLGVAPEPSHWVAVPATHAYSAADIKSPEIHALSFGSHVAVVAELRQFFETSEGHFIPKPHLWPVSKRFSDPVLAAQLHFGAPYLWGGNSIWGIDCSGLVQTAFLAAGQACPGDSDLQEAALGGPLGESAALARGDLVFWSGHVGLMVDAETMIHANAHHMAVAYEPVKAAILRIEARGGGPVTSRRRP
jgi:hypothetical protein